eukprot:6318013-Pyramimonas_sp.AAC.1
MTPSKITWEKTVASRLVDRPRIKQHRPGGSRAVRGVLATLCEARTYCSRLKFRSATSMW